MNDELCEAFGIPPRLRLNSREADSFNNESEKLYRWFAPNTEYLSDGRLSESTIGQVFSPPSNISCNRSNFCYYPTDVLYNASEHLHRNNYGVIQTFIKNVKNHTFEFLQTTQNNETVKIEIKLDIEHKPEECMYPHSEITIYRNGEKLTNQVKPPRLKTLLRRKLIELFTVCHEPNSNFQFEELS